MDVVTWTPERVEQLTQLFEEGLPTAEIGRRLGLTKNAVIGKFDPTLFGMLSQGLGCRPGIGVRVVNCGPPNGGGINRRYQDPPIR